MTAGTSRSGILWRSWDAARGLWRNWAAASSVRRDAWSIGLIAVAVYLVVDQSQAGTAFARFVADHPEYDLDDIVIGVTVLGLGALLFSVRRWRELRREVATRKLAEERLDRAQEIARIGSWEYDASANRYVWSKQMYRLRGLSPDRFEPTSSAVAAYVHPEDEPEIRRFRDDLKAGIRREPIEGRYIRPNGEQRVLRIEGQPVIDHDGVIRRVSGTMQDITEQKLLQRQLVQSQKMEVIGHLVGGMAHDFNNVLGIVIGNLELLQDHTTGNVPSEELRDDALSAALHGAELTRQLLAYARRQPLLSRNTDVNELIQSTSRLLVRLLGEHVELRLNLEPGLWPVLVDPTQMEAALTNLASNARDAMERGGTLTIATRNLHMDPGGPAEHPELVPKDYVVVEVSDTGAGIPSNIIGSIFEPFFTTKEQGKGSGLGLSMVYGFIKQSGGHVTVRSQTGTTFSLYLPRSLERRIDLVRADPTLRDRGVSGTLETLLVVEDNLQLRRATVKHLVDLGYRVFEAQDALAASTVLEINDAVGLLFTDVLMPGGMDGVDLVEWALARRPGLRCLVTSGLPDLGGRGQRLKAIGCKLLDKPYRSEELARAVRDTLEAAPSSSMN